MQDAERVQLTFCEYPSLAKKIPESTETRT